MYVSVSIKCECLSPSLEGAGYATTEAKRTEAEKREKECEFIF